MSAQDWNGKLHVVNASPLAKPWPRKPFWAVTVDGDVERLQPYEEATAWLGEETLTHYDDPERGCLGEDDLLGWCDSHEDACEVAELYLREEA